MAKKKKEVKEYIPKHRKMFEYQKELVDNSKKNYMYITDTGTGKSLMAIHHYLRHRKDENTNLIIVAPAQKVKEKGWDREIKNVEFSENISIPNYEVITYAEIVKRTKHILDMKPIKGVSLSGTRSKMLSEMFANTFFIVDECHFMKNRTSKRSKALFHSLKESDGWCMLSATPYPNGYIDLGVYLATAGFYESAYQYEMKNATYSERMFKLYNVRVPEREDRFWNNREKVDEEFKSFSSKPLKKEECLDLPKLIKVTNFFPKSSEYMELEATFGEFLTKFSGTINFGETENNSNFENEIDKIQDEKFNKLVQEISTFKLADAIKKIQAKKEKELSKKTVNDFRIDFLNQIDDDLVSVAKIFALGRQYANILDKVDFLMEFLEGTKNNVLVFYNFKIEREYIMKAIQERIEKKSEDDDFSNKTIYEVRGGENSLPDFQDYENLENTITLVQIQAGGAGIELQYCTDVVYFSPTWSYQDYSQSLGRAYRQGQEKNVTVYEYIVEDSMEEYIKSLLDNKKDFDFKMLMKLSQQR